MNLKLHFTGNPKAVQSFRYTKSGMRYQPFSVTDWKNYIRLAAQQQLPPGFVILDSPLMVQKKTFHAGERRQILQNDKTRSDRQSDERLD